MEKSSIIPHVHNGILFYQIKENRFCFDLTSKFFFTSKESLIKFLTA